MFCSLVLPTVLTGWLDEVNLGHMPELIGAMIIIRLFIKGHGPAAGGAARPRFCLDPFQLRITS